MSNRSLNNLRGFTQQRTLNNLNPASTTDIADIKNKYDFDGVVSSGNLLIGNSLGNYTTNRLTAGNNIGITNGDGSISIAVNDNIDTAGSITCKDFVKIKNTNNAVSSFGGILSLEGSVPQTIYPLRYKQQVFHSNVGDKFQILAEDNASNQRVLFELHSGTNNSTTHTVNFNNAHLTNISKINTYNANVLELNNNNQQFIVKDTNKNFTNGDILAVDINNKLTNTTATNIISNIVGGTNITRSVNTINLDSNLSNIVSINGYNASVLELNNNNQQFIVKDTSKYFLPNDIIGVDTNNKLTPILTRNGLNSINGYLGIATNPIIETPSFTIKNLTGECNLNIESGNSTSHESRLYFKNNGVERARMVYSSNNNKWDCLTLAGAIHFKAYKDTNDGTSRLLLDDGTFHLQAGSVSQLLTDIIRGDLNEIKQNRKVKIEPTADNYTDNEFMLHINSYDDKACKVCIQSDIVNTFVSKETSLIFKNHFIQADIGLNVDNKLYLHHPSTNTNQSRVEFFLGSATKDSNSLIFELTPTLVNMYKPLDMRENPIYLKGGGNVNHFIKFTDVANVINGPRISGFGGANRAVFDIVSQETTIDKVLFSVSNDKISMKTPLYMNSTTTDDRPVYLHDNTDFFIKYQNSSGQNVVECKGFNGVHLGSTAGSGNINLKVEQDRVEITKMKVIDFINLDNKEIRLRADDDPWQILGYKNDGESISGSSINIDGWFMRGWNGGRLASVKGINNPASESNNVHHAVWYMSNDEARFGGPYGYNNYSDDRIKFEETTITNALQTINKLNPVMYKKGKFIGDTDYSNMKLESGFVAQEVYNNVPEMRHLVNFDKSLSRNFVDGDLNSDCIEDIYSKKTDSNGITHEKPEICSVCYDEVIPFAVKAIQELHILINTLQQQLTTQSTLISNLQSQINSN